MLLTGRRGSHSLGDQLCCYLGSSHMLCDANRILRRFVGRSSSSGKAGCFGEQGICVILSHLAGFPSCGPLQNNQRSPLPTQQNIVKIDG